MHQRIWHTPVCGGIEDECGIKDSCGATASPFYVYRMLLFLVSDHVGKKIIIGGASLIRRMLRDVLQVLFRRTTERTDGKDDETDGQRTDDGDGRAWTDGRTEDGR